MSDSTANFTQADFKAARNSVKAGLNHAEIKYTLDGQPHTFTTEVVSGGLSRTLIFGGKDVGIAWRYVKELENKQETFKFVELPNAVFAIGLSDYSEVLGGTLDVHVESIEEDCEETATITGTITDAEFRKVTDKGEVASTVKVNGTFTYFFSGPL